VGPSPPHENAEVVLPVASQLRQTTKFRSTWILASLQTVREKGFGDAYLANLPRIYHEPITLGVASQWFDLELALAHYSACESLGLPVETQIAFGREVSIKMQRTILGAAVRLAKTAGVTPWTVYKQLDRFWSRIAVGGAIGVYKLGPKEARAELVQCPVLDIPYFRNAVGGVLWGITDLFCQRAFVREIPTMRTPTHAAYRSQWV
jgi:hypothetical protein